MTVLLQITINICLFSFSTYEVDGLLKECDLITSGLQLIPPILTCVSSLVLMLGY